MPSDTKPVFDHDEGNYRHERLVFVCRHVRNRIFKILSRNRYTEQNCHTSVLLPWNSHTYKHLHMHMNELANSGRILSVLLFSHDPRSTSTRQAFWVSCSCDEFIVEIGIDQHLFLSYLYDSRVVRNCSTIDKSLHGWFFKCKRTHNTAATACEKSFRGCRLLASSTQESSTTTEKPKTRLRVQPFDSGKKYEKPSHIQDDEDPRLRTTPSSEEGPDSPLGITYVSFS